MATYNTGERTDFNLTGDFGSGDLDLSWAHIQVKRLVATSGNTTITIGGEEFDTSVVPGLRNAVQKMYTTNIDAGIAEASVGPAYDLPEVIGTPRYVRMWKLNDCIPHDNISDNRNVTPTSLYESVLNEHTGTVSGDFYWARQGKNDPQLLTLNNTGQVSLNDRGLVNNDGPYTLGFTFTIETFGDNVLFSKGSMKVTLGDNQIILSRDGTTKALYYSYPNGKNKFDYRNVETQFHLQRFKVLFDNGSAAALVKIYLDQDECIQKNDLNLGAILLNDDLNQNLIFKNRPIKYLKDVYIMEDILTFPKSTESLFFASRLDQTNSYNRLTGINELLGDFGGYAEMNNMPATQGQQNAWVPVNTSGNSQGTPPFVERNLKNGYNRNFIVKNFDVSKNFTISFWTRGWSQKKFEMMDITDGENLFRLTSLNIGALLVNFPNANDLTISSNVDWLNDYTHVIISKNGGFLDFIINGEFVGRTGVGDKFGTMSISDIYCGTTKVNSQLFYSSSFKVMQYAVLPPYLNDQTSAIADPIIARLKGNLI